jgi:sugar/nucleoside kinase (ribokinase family)
MGEHVARSIEEMPLLVIAGNLTIDDTVLPDGRTAMGAIGGDVLYTGLGAALWTQDVGLLSRVGEDFPTEHLERIRAAGLDTAGLVSCAGPSIRYWVLYEWDGRRHFIHRTAENRLDALSPEPSDLPPHYGSTAHAFHVAALPFGQVDRLVRAAAHLTGAPLITLDTHEDFVVGYQEPLTALLPLLGAFLPSREETALWFGDDDPERHIGELLTLGPRIVVIKMGADGALVQQQGQPRPRHIPVVPVTVVDVTGAGDAFCGGFVARLAAGADPYEAAMAGAVSATFAVEAYGIEGLLGISMRDRDERLKVLRAREMEHVHGR